MRIIGLDVSTASTGMALADGQLVTIRPRAGADQPARRLWESASEVHRRAGTADLAVVEAPAPGAIGILGKLANAETCGAVIAWLHELAVVVVRPKPNTLKMYATGHGRADKTMMRVAAHAAGVATRNADEADAFWLRAMARHYYLGERPDGRFDLDRQRERALTVVAWPKVAVTS